MLLWKTWDKTARRGKPRGQNFRRRLMKIKELSENYSLTGDEAGFIVVVEISLGRLR